MTHKFDKVFVYPSIEEPFEYVFVDTQVTEFFRGAGRTGFRNTVSFPVKTYRGEGNTGMPVVFDDFTLSSSTKLVEIEYTDLPKGIKQRYARWEKYQTED